MPWKGVVRETLSTGDVMVKIPKFYYQRYLEGNVEYIKIADRKVKGFELHPAFNHAGVEKDYVYVAAYGGVAEAGTNRLISKKGYRPSSNATRASFRGMVTGKGAGWCLLDISTLSAIQMLILVEFANNNVQETIGKGNVDSRTEAVSNGSCDSVPNLTGTPTGTNGKVGVVYRGIENLWGNICNWIDGINCNARTPYVCDTFTFTDDTSTGYTQISFNLPSSNYITAFGYDSNNDWILLPSESSSTANVDGPIGDITDSYSGWVVAMLGGTRDGDSAAGAFCWGCHTNSSKTSANIGARLMYIPSAT
jgi:hypothetical protein